MYKVGRKATSYGKVAALALAILTTSLFSFNIVATQAYPAGYTWTNPSSGFLKFDLTYGHFALEISTYGRTPKTGLVPGDLWYLYVNVTSVTADPGCNMSMRVSQYSDGSGYFLLSKNNIQETPEGFDEVMDITNLGSLYIVLSDLSKTANGSVSFLWGLERGTPIPDSTQPDSNAVAVILVISVIAVTVVVLVAVAAIIHTRRV